ncbi:MAG TPA: M28 family peptidase [Acidobacteriota bacterium]|jgi:Zn-dependent M28 family amino/carboxypeptidase
MKKLMSLILLLLFNCSGKTSSEATTFDSGRAFSHVEKLVSYGPRSVGSEGHARALQYIDDELKVRPLDVEHQTFDAITPAGTLKMVNVIARQRNSANPVIVFASHYDTLTSDQFTFVGANDGGSSTGLLLELAGVLASRKSDFQYWFVFFDGEEAIRQWSDLDSLYGSREMVRRLKGSGDLSRIKAFILLDMIGDRNLNIRRDSSSTGWLNDLFWDTAARGNYSGFEPASQYVMDDHTPFLMEGIPAIDLIDFDYGPGNVYWHTPADTLDKVSAESLRQVGEVVIKTLPAVEDNLRKTIRPRVRPE